MSNNTNVNMRDTVIGTVEAVIYQSPDGGYTVCELEDENGEPCTVVGDLTSVSEGMHIKAYGEWGTHPTYGRQFRCEYFEQEMPETEGEILRYLSAGNVKGIGPKTALRIVERYGTESFDVIENHPEWLAEIPGISETKAVQIGESFRAASGVRSVIMYCRNVCSPAVSMKIYKKWGTSAVDKIKSNPYCLCHEIAGIGFRRADELAVTLGIPADSRERIEAGALYVLGEEARREGHTRVPFDTLVGYMTDMLCIERSIIEETVKNIAQGGVLKASKVDGTGYLSLPKYYNAEFNIYYSLSDIIHSTVIIDKNDISEFITSLEMTTGITYAPMQREAIAKALSCGVMILTGGPGTGKTTVIKGIMSIFESIGMKCALAAPTGRAAKRMSEATSHEAKTIHRLLEVGFSMDDDGERRFMRDQNNPLDEDVIIVDEVSMVDVLLMDSLLRAIKRGARLILVGDADQLPSVGAGNLLGDFLACSMFQVVRLTEVHRQADSSFIVKNAHSVNSGIVPVSGGVDSDFFIIRKESDADVASTVADLCTRRLPIAYGNDITKNIQIISPSKKGAAGTEELCRVMQTVMNPPATDKNEIVRGTTVFREGDRVMQIKNNYSICWTKNGFEGTGAFNGDVGIICSIDAQSKEITVDYDGRLTTYESTELDEIELSYAITVHKSQGSEYPVVVIPVYECVPMLLNRRLLYTAITRASKMCIIVARNGYLEQMVANKSQTKRMTVMQDILEMPALL